MRSIWNMRSAREGYQTRLVSEVQTGVSSKKKRKRKRAKAYSKRHNVKGIGRREEKPKADSHETELVFTVIIL